MTIRIKRCSIWMLFFAVFMIRPYYVTLYAQLNMIWAYSTLFCAVITSCMVLNHCRLRKETTIIALFCATYLLATLSQTPKSLASAVSSIAQIVLPYNMGILLMNGTKRPSLEKNVSFVFSCYLYADALCTFLHVSERLFGLPKELTLLGYDNYAAFNVLAMLAVKFAIDEKQNNGKITIENILCYSVCCAGKILTGSVAACISLFAFAVIKLVLRHDKNVTRKCRPNKVIFLLMALFILVYYFKIYQVFAALLLELGKGSDLNSRTIIWNKVLHHIMDIPLILIGKGHYTEEEFRAFFEFPYGFNATHPHNIILCILVDTGAIGLMLYCKWLSKVIVNKAVVKVSWYKTLLIGLICYLFQGFWDYYTFLSGFYILLGTTISYGTLLSESNAQSSANIKELHAR